MERFLTSHQQHETSRMVISTYPLRFPLTNSLDKISTIDLNVILTHEFAQSCEGVRITMGKVACVSFVGELDLPVENCELESGVG